MKKTISIFIALLLCLSAAGISVSAEKSLSIKVESFSTAPGKTVAVPVTLSNNPGFWGMIFDLNFDTSVLEVSQVRNNGEVMDNGEILIGPADFGDGYVRFTGTGTSLTSNNKKNGTLMIVYFKVLDSAKLGKTALKLSYTDKGNFCDCDYNNITPKFSDGELIIEKNAVAPTLKPNKTGNVVASAAADNKNDNKAKAEEDKTIKPVEAVTDKNGSTVKDTTISGKTAVSPSETVTSNKEELNSSSDSFKEVKDESNTGIYYFIVAGVLLLLIIALVAVLIIKKRRENAEKK